MGEYNVAALIVPSLFSRSMGWDNVPFNGISKTFALHTSRSDDTLIDFVNWKVEKNNGTANISSLKLILQVSVTCVNLFGYTNLLKQVICFSRMKC